MLLCVSPAPAAEIYSNALGGGDWDDPSTWRGDVVPGADDIAVISRDDAVTFARDDTDQLTCRELHIDPGGALRFAQRRGRVVMRVGGEARSHGAILLDATRGRDDYMALHLIAPEQEKRRLIIHERGSLVALGREGIDETDFNVQLMADKPEDAEGDSDGAIAVRDGCGLDLRRVHVDNIKINASDIDNTGASYNERLNVEHSRFTRGSCIRMTSCDTPVIANNTFSKEAAGWVQPGAISLYSTTLADVRGNHISGWYYTGINAHGSTDCSLVDNTVKGAAQGVGWYGQNLMIQRFTAIECGSGVMLNYASGAIDQLVTDGCRLGLHHARAEVQISNWEVRNAKRDYVVDFTWGQLIMLNCNVTAEQVKLADRAGPIEEDDPGPLVRSMHYVIAGVKGDVPPHAFVDLQTKGWKPPRPGAMDLNVRNNPAPVTGMGLTPLPGTMQALIARAWEMDLEQKLHPAPTYDLHVMQRDGDGFKTLKTIEVTPTDAWFRAKPNEPTPTVEVGL